MSEADVPFRILPDLSGDSSFFWKAGAAGELQFLRCRDCGTRIHPPQPLCPLDHSKNLAPEAVSGRATICTFTINHQVWMPGPEPPFVVAIVTIEEDPSIRLTTNIVGCKPEEVSGGYAGSCCLRASL